ncbi:RlpA-like double-psi beta-barrel-protein domain-containing protein-containing protein [Ampelomyces quisqualis]|uniref:RlpA-like double-psi beta-barrel-protein domain-containing protein-containing protein n=1 Tax=Ampelomyces quisqualis TaxID=50730 RepID=A0A6A5QHU1_AMPQU|nr:RlpA-like double-psi beta-barrel-protein domain-containing protein-containing protein [Ampelomyces quisqualis]
MKSAIFNLLPLAGLAFAESSCDTERKTVTHTQYESVTVTAVANQEQATPEASVCSRRTVTSTEVEKVTITVDVASEPIRTIDVTSTSTQYTETTITIRPTPAVSSVASSLQWGSYSNATFHASSAAASPTSQLPDFSIIDEAAKPTYSADTKLSTASASETKTPSEPSPVPETPEAEAGSDSNLSPAGSKRGDATFYGGNTAGGMCSFTGYTIPSGVFGTALSDSNWAGAQACGQCVSVTGPGGNKLTAMVVDQCPGCGNNHLDLYPDAFKKLADPSKGIISVSWDFVPCGITSPIVLKNKSGTSKFWFSMQVMNANVAIAKLEVSTDGGNTWKATTRQPYNFFENPAGFGADMVDVKVTSTNGKSIITKGVSIASDSMKTCAGNF